MTPCPRAGRWIGGCRFEARYEIRSTDISRLPSDLQRRVIEPGQERVYVRDVCRTCGRTIERQERQP